MMSTLTPGQHCQASLYAGQGYIWMAHRDPNSPSWLLARRSKAIWEHLAATTSGSPLGKALEWQVCTGGSIHQDFDAKLHQKLHTAVESNSSCSSGTRRNEQDIG